MTVKHYILAWAEHIDDREQVAHWQIYGQNEERPVDVHDTSLQFQSFLQIW